MTTASAVRTAFRTSEEGPLRRTGRLLGVLAVLVVCLGPFSWMIISSFKPAAEIFDNRLIPQTFSWENYAAVFGNQNTFGLALSNSLVIAGTVTLIALLIGSVAAFALARLDFPFKRVTLAIFLAASMFPGVAILSPLFQLFADLGWIDTLQAMIIPDISFALPLAVWILTNFFSAIPDELSEAAQVDGATPMQTFRKILFPLAVPGIFTTAILVFIAAWNEFLIANSMSQTPESQPVTVAIAKFTGDSQFDQPFGTQMAAGVVVTIPLVVVVLIFQRRIISGLTAGGVKS